MHEELLIEQHPVLYHMAEGGTWQSIRSMGLRSTEALLDKLGADEKERHKILRSHRSAAVVHQGVRIRDQKPMGQNLARCLQPAGITPEQWLEFLNRKVFFWATPKRLKDFRDVYRNRPQLIIEIPTARMVNAHRQKSRLCHINAGATRMPNHYRSFDTFRTIESFDYSSRKKPAEFTVEYSVPDIEKLASKVYEIVDGQEAVLHQD